MERRNVTVSIPSEVLQKVKIVAAKRNTSVSALMTAALESLAEDEEEYERAMERDLALMRTGLGLETKGKSLWTRDQLHER